MISRAGYSDHDVREAALLLLSLGSDAGGRIDPRRISRRAPGSLSRLSFGVCQSEGWTTADGRLTDTGRAVLVEWEAGR